MSVIAGLQDFRQAGPPADIGTFQLTCSVMVFQHTFSGTTRIAAIRSGERGWVLIAYDADATVVIQAAIDALPGIGGEVLILPGTYTITDTITINADFVRLVGCGQATKIYNSNVAAANAITVTGPVVSPATREGNQLCDFEIYGNEDSFHGIYAEHIYRLLVCNVFSHTHGSCGLRLSNCNDPIVTNCRFATNDVDGLNAKGCHELFVHSCWAGDNTRDGFRVDNADGYHSYENIFVGCGSENNVNGFYILKTDGTAHCRQHVISGCTTDDNDSNGMKVEGGDGHSVTGNTNYRNTFNGISVGTDDVTVTGNTCIDNGSVGILLNDATDVVVVGNRCYSLLQQDTGISEIGTSDYNVIAHNNVRGNETNSILPLGTHTWVEGNLGYNPVGPVANPYTAGAGALIDSAEVQAHPATNTNYTIGQSPKFITIYDGVVTSISIDGTVTGLTSGSFYLSPGQVFNVVWTGQPSSVVYAI